MVGLATGDGFVGLTNTWPMFRDETDVFPAHRGKKPRP